MKKMYAFFAAALMSASLFAAAPTAADLANVYDVANNVVFCIQFVDDAEKCNDVRFVGTPNNWGKGDVEGASESWDNCEKFQPVEGFDGWWAAELAYSEGFEGKPLQEPTDRAWTWDYQCGDMNAWEHVDGLELSLSAGFADECNIKANAPGAYIYKLKYWKKHKSPCVPVVKHTYTINLYAPDACEDMTPAIAGDDFEKGWNPNEMQLKFDEFLDEYYSITFEGQEGHGFKFLELTDGWDNEMQWYDSENDEWKKFENIELGAEVVITLDYRDNEKYRFTLCDTEEAVERKFAAKLPAAGCPAEVEIIGSIGEGWNVGTAMAFNASTGFWEATVSCRTSHEFKFRGPGSYDYELLVPDAEKEGEWKAIDNLKVKDFLNDNDEVEVDLSDAEKYRWSVPSGVENVVLGAEAKKVMVDGVMYIVRDNKLFNVQGAQIR